MVISQYTLLYTLCYHLLIRSQLNFIATLNNEVIKPADKREAAVLQIDRGCTDLKSVKYKSCNLIKFWCMTFLLGVTPTPTYSYQLTKRSKLIEKGEAREKGDLHRRNLWGDALVINFQYNLQFQNIQFVISNEHRYIKILKMCYFEQSTIFPFNHQIQFSLRTQRRGKY
ncbi:Hypothetical_protein [Hexamita inflata]|uniref:Hypothetical_protein n=1 Tax=Hexamita inflata TaxID=28002 RepID=A0AA86QLV1_9EUKA|nr:Hypothetical protein HINF_LOCUS49609 [Hexamita inflata]